MEETGNWSRLEEAVAENPTVDAIRSEGRAWLGADFPPQILFLARTQLLRAVKSLPDCAHGEERADHTAAQMGHLAEHLVEAWPESSGRSIQFSLERETQRLNLAA